MRVNDLHGDGHGSFLLKASKTERVALTGGTPAALTGREMAEYLGALGSAEDTGFVGPNGPERPRKRKRKTTTATKRKGLGPQGTAVVSIARK